LAPGRGAKRYGFFISGKYFDELDSFGVQVRIDSRISLRAKTVYGIFYRSLKGLYIDGYYGDDQGGCACNGKHPPTDMDAKRIIFQPFAHDKPAKWNCQE
jgi:hypothetical protein